MKKKTSARPSAQARSIELQTSPGWTLTRKPHAIAKKGARRRAAAGEVLEAGLPEAMTRGDFEVLDVVEATPSDTRRGAGGNAVPLRATVPADAPVLLVVRQASGAISFHRPATTVQRPARRGAAATIEVEFSVTVLAGDPQTARRGVFSKVSAILVKLVRSAADLIVDPLAQLAVPWLSHELEKRLWKGRPQGWLRVTQPTLAAGSLAPAIPTFSESQRGLLFLHGTFSNAGSAFRPLATEPFFAGLREIYGDHIYAFDHFTFSATPEENVRDLLAALPPGKLHFDVITHSRGGLVLRTLTEATADTTRVQIGRVVLVASPNAGTPLASPQHWEDKLSWFANLLELLPDHPFVTGAEWLANALIWFADKVVGNAPGLAAMDGQGETIADLQAMPAAPAEAQYYALASNFYPPQHWWSRLADMGVDAFFGGANDLVVPTEGGWQTDADPTSWVPGDRIGCFGPGGNLAPDEPAAVTHVSFFNRPETADFILKALRGAALEIPPIDPEAPLVLRTRRGGRKILPQEPAPRREKIRAVEAKEVFKTPAVPAGLGGTGWDDEGTLLLTVIAQHNAANMKDSPTPLLLATYNGARVVVPLFTKNQPIDKATDDPEKIAQSRAGSRWFQIINMQEFMVDYTNVGQGKPISVQTAEGTKKEFSEPSEEFLQILGTLLFETLVTGPVKRLYDAARFSNRNRRLHIIFSSMIPWIADFPWELAFDPGCETFLATSDVRFIRNVLSPMPGNRIEERSRLRILVVSAQPAGSIPLSIEEERGRIIDSFKPLTESGLVEVQVIERATPEALHGCLREQADGEEFDVVHFIGHGEFDRERNVGYVLFEDENGCERRVSASQLLDILRGRGVRIVFLNACETGRGASAKYNQGVAMVLARDGIPAVVANQYSVVDSSASLFALHFYACLASGIGIADATREARITVRYSQTEPMDWGVPVLFARNPHATLCARRRLEPGQSVDQAAFKMLFGRRRAARLAHRRSIAVWSMSDSLTYREKLGTILEQMNAAQDEFGFLLKERPIPAYLWTVEKGTGYLNVDRIGSRVEKIRRDFGVDYLLCVTDLPLQDEETSLLYLWTGEKADEKGQPDLNRIFFFSIWGLQPPLQGPTFQAALANCIAIALVEEISEIEVSDEAKYTLGYYNAERDVAHIAGRLHITAKSRRQMKSGKKITPEQLQAIETLLALFHPPKE